MFWNIVIIAVLAFIVWAFFTPHGRAKMAEVQAAEEQKKKDKLFLKQVLEQPDYNDNRFSHDGFEDTSNDSFVYPVTHYMEYTNRDDGSSNRDIGVVRAYRQNGKRWYIDAYCYNRGEVRTFAVESIAVLEDFATGHIYTTNKDILEHIKSYQ